MKILTRITDLFKSNINHAITQMEDPEKMLKNYIFDMENSIEKTEASVAKAIANRNNLQKKLEKAEKNYDMWTNRAELAAEKNEDDLAKEALAKRKIEKSNINTLTPMVKSATDISEDLKDKLSKFKIKLDEAKSRESILIARATQAKTQKEFNKILADIGSDNGFTKFNKYEEKIENMESEAAAYEELGNEEKSLDDQFKELDSINLDEELAELKKNLNIKSSTKAKTTKAKTTKAKTTKAKAKTK